MIEPLAMRLPLPSLQPAEPISLIGFGKSGKSLLASALARTGAIVRYPTEGNQRLFMPGLYPWHASSMQAPPLWWDDAPTRAIVEEAYAGEHGRRVRTTLELYARSRGARLLVDNGNVTYWLDAYRKLLPGSRFVMMARDPRDAVAEVARNTQRKVMREPRYRQLGDISEIEIVDRIARHWARGWSAFAALRREGAATLVRFEDLTAAPEDTLATVMQWLGLPERSLAAEMPVITPPPRDSSMAARIMDMLDRELASSERDAVRSHWGV